MLFRIFSSTTFDSISLDEVKHLKMYLDENEIDINNIEILGNSVEEVKRSFEKVNLKSINDMNLDIESIDACSSCENAFILSLMCAPGISMKDKKIYLGTKRNSSEKPSDKKTVAFGKCCIKSMKDADYKIHGCPPYPFELGKQLSKAEE